MQTFYTFARGFERSRTRSVVCLKGRGGDCTSLDATALVEYHFVEVVVAQQSDVIVAS